MGGQLSLITPTATTVSIDAYIVELGDVQYERNLGNARFLKTILGSKKNSGLVVVKVFIKSVQDENLRAISKQLLHQREKLVNVPNAIAYDKVVETDRAGYIVRQFFKANLYDRISTRPFLEHIEKKWITYQLIRALCDCHELGIYHGDLKTENLMVTSWNWVYLTDFAVFKPVYLPEDDPSRFSFFFDTSMRRTCYVAPERFLAENEADANSNATLDEKMDIFSLGCVIAELFLEGSPIFSLAQLFKYKRGEYKPSLESVGDPEIRSLIESMISLDPAKRLTAKEYLTKADGTMFPSYFPFLHSYILKVMKPIADLDKLDSNSRKMIADNRILQVFNDYQDISKNLGFVYDNQQEIKDLPDPSYAVPVRLDLPGMEHWCPNKKMDIASEDNGALMILALVTCCLRSTSRSSTRVKACDLLLALGEQVNDEAKIDRCLPYLAGLLDDPSENVQTTAIRNITHILTLVTTIPPLQENIFSEYLLPRFSVVLNKSSEMVRATYASCLPTLAQTAAKFLDMGQILRATGTSIHTESDQQQPQRNDELSLDDGAQDLASFDLLRRELLSDIEGHVRSILSDSSREVKRSLLRCIAPLCFFFGRQKTNDIILSHSITFLNDKDPFLRLELFESMIGIGPFIGNLGLKEYVIPLMLQTLVDPEEFVLQKVLQALGAFCDMGLIPLDMLWGILKECAKFIIHPNNWIRISTLGLFSSSTRWMTAAQIHCMLMPILRPYLQCDVIEFSEASLLENIKQPLPRSIYNLTMTWATKAQKSLFWKDTQRNPRGGSVKSPSSGSRGSKDNNNSNKYVAKSHRHAFSAEDETWLNRLKEIGLKEDQLWMLATFKDYIYNVASLKVAKGITEDTTTVHVDLQSLGAFPNTVFFDPKVDKGSSRNKYGSYTGHNPYVRRLLGRQLTDSVSQQELFGPQCEPFNPLEVRDNNSHVASLRKKKGHPLGILVSSFEEHTDAINSIIVPSDHAFLVTASEDGSIKIWDASRLEKNVINSSVQSFDFGSPVKQACFVSNTHTIVCATEDGMINFVRVDFNPQTRRYRKLALVHRFQLPLETEYGVCLATNSINNMAASSPFSLFIATSESRLLIFNLNSLTIEHAMQNPPKHGYITSMALDSKASTWILLGTSRGLLDLWDIRFELRVRSWGINGGSSPITSICVHPKHDKYVCITGGVMQYADMSVWDIESTECKEVYRAGSSQSIGSLYNAINTDRVLNEPNDKSTVTKILIDEDSIAQRTARSAAMMCLTSGLDFDDLSSSSTSSNAFPSNATKRAFVVTGGHDKNVRFWDLYDPESSLVLSGLKLDSEKGSYTVHQSSIKLVTEKLVTTSQTSRSSTERSPRANVITSDQVDLGRNHQACITAVCYLKRPYDLIVSGDQSGVIKIYL